MPVATSLKSPVLIFQLRKKTFVRRGLLPMAGLMIAGTLLLTYALLRRDDLVTVLGYMLIFFSGVVFVLSAKKYYRCPACEKVVVPLADNGKPSEVSFAIAYNPQTCPYCGVALK
jgi:hypothetical protein